MPAGLVYGLVTVAAAAYTAVSTRRQQKKMKEQLKRARESSPSKYMFKNASPPKQIILGHCCISGPEIFGCEIGNPNDNGVGEYIHVVVHLAGHECEDITNLWFDDVELTRKATATGNASIEFEHSNGSGWCYVYLGNHTSAPSTLAGLQDWDDSMKGLGQCFAHMKIRTDNSKWPNSIPNLKAAVKGMKLFDPRTGQTAWSDNPALMLRWYRTELKNGVPIDETYITAANICDELVSTPNGTEKRYRCNYSFFANATPRNVMAVMRASCGGESIRVAGRHALYVAAYYGPASVVLTPDDIVGDIETVPDVRRRDRINGVSATYTDSEDLWSETDMPIVRQDDLIIDDGIENIDDLDLEAVPSPYQAQRLASVHLLTSRDAFNIKLTVNQKGTRLLPGSLFYLDFPENGWDDVEFRVSKWISSVEGKVSLEAEQTKISHYEFDGSVAKIPERPGIPNLINRGVQEPANFAYSESVENNIRTGVVTWDHLSLGATTFEYVLYKSGVRLDASVSSDKFLRIDSIVAGNYELHVTAIFQAIRSGTAIFSFAAGAAPNPPTLTTTPKTTAIQLDWIYAANPAEIADVEIRASLDKNFANSFLIAKLPYPTSTFTYFGLNYGAEMWFWVRALDKADLASAWSPLGDGVYGRSSIDSTEILSYLEEKIGAGELAPGLIDDIVQSVDTDFGQKLDEINDKLDSVDADLIGYLSGDDENAPDDVLWYVGDDDTQDSFVGNKSITSAYNSHDYAQVKAIFILGSRVAESEAYISRVDAVTTSRDEALAQSIEKLSASIDDNAAAIINESKVRVTANLVLANDINALTADIDGNAAAILNEQSARASADNALSQSISTLTSRVGSAESAIQTEQSARASADNALSQSISTLTSRIGSAESAVQQTSNAVTSLDNSIKAEWQVKTQVRSDGRVVQAGVGLGASIGANGQSRSEFLVLADTIGFLNSINGKIHSPFVFDTTNDTAILNAAIIGDATINFAKISDTLQSTPFTSGSVGWRIRKNGTVEFNSGVFRGTVYVEHLEGDVTDTKIIKANSTVTATVSRPSSGTDYGYATIGTLNFGTKAWSRTFVVLGGLRFDNTNGAGRVEFVRNGSVAYYSDTSGINSYEIDDNHLTHAGSFTIPANSSGVITVRIRVALPSNAPSTSASARFYAQSVVANVFKS